MAKWEYDENLKEWTFSIGHELSVVLIQMEFSSLEEDEKERWKMHVERFDPVEGWFFQELFPLTEKTFSSLEEAKKQSLVKVKKIAEDILLNISNAT